MPYCVFQLTVKREGKATTYRRPVRLPFVPYPNLVVNFGRDKKSAVTFPLVIWHHRELEWEVCRNLETDESFDLEGWEEETPAPVG